MSQPRIGGRIRKKEGTFAIAVGDDAKHYFFMPTDVVPPSRFEDLREGIPVQFTPFKHTRIDRSTGKEITGDRCTDLVVLAVDPHLHSQSHGSTV